ncbi:amidohydrolase [Brevibacterium jeotgali]|uniref:Amidohydrolase n=1 Tax=Brevibacterium jeotgali TaxID=1262550 RepID=A0A2H1L743_9MICO|nr:amidohydrolase [Brevibacterium jeotgali]TWC02222.1 amidohydrolase [Brevibacterium jeotgali]SMY12726.1 amidohydrolase [Brevibacterium jeotgali]
MSGKRAYVTIEKPGAHGAGRILAELGEELIAFRRDVHAHPELSFEEHRTTRAIADRLRAAGLAPEFVTATGLICDVGEGPVSAVLRADIDALPLDDLTGLPWASTVPEVAHACGHDVHLTALLGAGLALDRLHRETSGGLGGTIRLVFQPAEEVTPGGALTMIGQGVLEGVRRSFALHCDPNVDVGSVGSRIGPITAAGDTVIIRLSGHGGHTSRPHLTEDLVYALSRLATDLPATLSRLIDPRHAISLVWGHIESGHAPNAIPSTGLLTGTLRCLDVDGWNQVAEVLPDLVDRIAGPYGVQVDLDHRRGVPPVVNTEPEVSLAETAVREVLGPDSVQLTPQSMGGEDFAWYLAHTPGALIRLGTRTPGGRTYDLHQGDLVVDERAIATGARILCSIALRAIADDAGAFETFADASTTGRV